MTNNVHPTADPRLQIVRENLKLAVALRGTNYSEAATKAGLSRNVLSNFIRGNSAISYPAILKICDILQIPIGIIHKQDAITQGRISVAQALDRLPDHLVSEALSIVQQGGAGPHQS